MFIPPENILVLGHRNPDTDASTSAQAYASFLGRTSQYDAPVMAGIVGNLPPQSIYVFQKAELAPPPVVENLFPRVCDVANRKVEALSVNDRFRDAVEMLIRSDRSMLPVLDRDGKLHSVFSHRRDVSRFLFGFDVIPLASSLLDWQDLAAIPGARSLGRLPPGPQLSGQLRVSVEGERWAEALAREDILISGDLAVLHRLPPERFPRWVVLVSQPGEPTPEQVNQLNERGSFLILYRHSALDFLFSLLSQVRVGALNLDTGPCVGEFDFLHDIQEVITGSRHALPVLSTQGTLVGTVSRTDLQGSPKRRVILIDHFESSQAVVGIQHAEILEIIDHHRVGDLETTGPVRVECRPLGSSSTIVALRYFESSVKLDRGTAILLLGGLVSDTLCLRSPTTTAVDQDVATRLASIIGAPLEDFGREVLRAGDDLLISDPAKIWKRDQKTFSVRNHTFAVAQLETVSLEEIPEHRLDAFQDLLSADFGKGTHLVSLLFLTDVLTGDSWIASRESVLAPGVVESCFGAVQPRKGWTLAKGVVSRKKQIVPRLLRALAEIKR